MILSNGKVFVVDDDPAIRESLRFLLESVDLRVETYASAEEFLDKFNVSWGGCLVLDVKMPGGMGGLALQQELAVRGASIPIVFITAHGDIPLAVRACKAGALDFIEKPFSDAQLLQLVRAVFDDEERHSLLTQGVTDPAADPTESDEDGVVGEQRDGKLAERRGGGRGCAGRRGAALAP